MSVQRGCETIELTAGQWFCVVATAEYDYDFADATAYGPARTAEDAWKLMSDAECNPGGGCETTHDLVDDGQRALIQRARKGEVRRSSYRW
jgi:hypothetical protein